MTQRLRDLKAISHATATTTGQLLDNYHTHVYILALFVVVVICMALSADDGTLIKPRYAFWKRVLLFP